MEKQSPLISVIMPLYNAERFVGESIGNILGQTVGGFRADRYRRRLDGLLVRHRKPLCRARRTDRPDAQRREPRRRLYPQPGAGDSAREFHYVHGCRRPLFAGTFRPPDSILRTAPADRPVRQLLYDVRAGRCPGTEDPGSHHARRNPDPDAFRLPVRNVGGS